MIASSPAVTSPPAVAVTSPPSPPGTAAGSPARPGRTGTAPSRPVAGRPARPCRVAAGMVDRLRRAVGTAARRRLAGRCGDRTAGAGQRRRRSPPVASGLAVAGRGRAPADMDRRAACAQCAGAGGLGVAGTAGVLGPCGRGGRRAPRAGLARPPPRAGAWGARPARALGKPLSRPPGRPICYGPPSRYCAARRSAACWCGCLRPVPRRCGACRCWPRPARRWSGSAVRPRPCANRRRRCCGCCCRRCPAMRCRSSSTSGADRCAIPR
ncbi:hypothetical protein OJJOAM_004974 [Cupriavidus sp. H18C1]